MNEFVELSGLGLTMPSLLSILSAIALSVVGIVFYRRGRRLKIPRLTWCGLLLMIYPNFVADTGLLWGIGMAVVWLALRRWVPEASDS